jgi:hypothetical protein
MVFLQNIFGTIITKNLPECNQNPEKGQKKPEHPQNAPVFISA